MRRRSDALVLAIRRAQGAAIVLVVGVALAVISAVALVSRENTSLNEGKRQTIRVSVEDASGVVPGRNEVRWAGVVVGRITKVDLQGRRAVLTADVDRSKAGGGAVYRDATLALRPQTLLQDMYLDIERRGTPAAGAADAAHVLDATRTASPVSVADVLDVFDEPPADHMRVLVDELAAGLEDHGTQLRAAFAAFLPLLRAQHRLTATLAQRRRIVAGLVHDTAAIVDAVGRRDRELTTLTDAGAALTAATSHRAPELGRTLGELPPSLGQLRTSLATLRGTLSVARPALGDLRPAARALPAGLAAVRAFSADATPALTAARTPVRRLRPVAADLSPVARALGVAFARLAPQMPRLDRVTAAVSRCDRFVPKFFALTLSVLKWGSSGTLTAAPRGDFVFPPSSAGGQKDPDLEPIIGCADGRPTP